MHKILPVIALACALPIAALAAADPSATPAYVTAAINDPVRKEDAAKDAHRQMAAVMSFIGVKPGDKVVELEPGGGYWTRVFSGIVGAKGQVYGVWAQEMQKYYGEGYAKWQGLSKQAPYTNMTPMVEPAATLGVQGPVDVVFTNQNYHDYHNIMGADGMARFNKQVFDALKPGGVYVIVDNVAAAGSGFSAIDTLHRVDPEAVKQEVVAAGFRFDGMSEALKNPADTHTLLSYKPPMAGNNDQFVFRFKKPMPE